LLRWWTTVEHYRPYQSSEVLMKLGSDGRLWPERAIEHFVFWPLIAVMVIGLAVGSRWLHATLMTWAGY
jgi:hypothetical protein